MGNWENIQKNSDGSIAITSLVINSDESFKFLSKINYLVNFRPKYIFLHMTF